MAILYRKFQELTTGATWQYRCQDQPGVIIVMMQQTIRYGKLYNWAAVSDPRGIAPEGWHVATYNECKKLIDSCLGGNDIAGRAMKEAGSTHWDDPLQMSAYIPTNSSGVTCLPGSYRAGPAFLNPLGFSGNWWCGTGDNDGWPCMVWLYHASNEVLFATTGNDGISIRCIKD